MPKVGITTTAEYQILTILYPDTAIYIAVDNQMFSHGLNLFFLFFGVRLCVPHRFRLRFTPPHTPIKDSLPVLLVCRGTEKQTKHGESIAYPEQLRKLIRAEYLNQTSVYNKYCMQFSPCMRVRVYSCVII